MPRQDKTIAYKTFLTIKAVEETGCDWFTAVEAVASTAIEHPEWNLDERRTFAEWEVFINNSSRKGRS